MSISNYYFITDMYGGQNLQRNFEITNIKMKKDELFDHFIFKGFFKHFFRTYLNTQNIQ